MSSSTPGPAKEPRISSPISTGGGGDQFEQHVVAYALGLLLVRAIPPVLTDTCVTQVHLQTSHLGWRTDDILIVGEKSDGGRRHLALQVKRNFTLSDRNDDCCVTIQGMWDDFLADDRFDPASDQLSIAVLHGTSALLHNFGSLLHCARGAADSQDFHNRVSREGYLSKQAKIQHDAVRTILEKHSSADVDPDRFWQFLRTLNVLSLDLNTATSQTKAGLLSLLSSCIAESADPLAAAKDTWAKLLECAGEGRPVAKSLRRQDLPAAIRERHPCVSADYGAALTALVDHGRTIREGIKSHIGENFVLDRSSQVQVMATELNEKGVLVVSGTAGSGKSALAKDLLGQLELGHIVFAFNAAELAKAHIDAVLAESQSHLTGQQLRAVLAGQGKTVFMVDGVERLLEHSIRDAFSHLVRLVQENQSIDLILTVREYSLETVRNALLAPLVSCEGIHFVKTLSDAELDCIATAVPSLAPPLGDAQFRSFLRTPYLLDMAARLHWADQPFPQSVREFRDRCWADLIRADHFSSKGMPRRRETAFLDIAYRRATELRPFVKPGAYDSEAITALIHDAVVAESPESSELFAVAHDVLEDWAILRWLDRRFAETEGFEFELADFVGGYPAIRRAFRNWLSERFQSNPDEARQFVMTTMACDALPAYFRDDCLASALQSDSAPDFLDYCRAAIVAGDVELLEQIVHTLRVACKQPPSWLGGPAGLSMMLVPAGSGWAAALHLVRNLADHILPERSDLVLSFLEDWSKGINWQTPYPDGAEDAGFLVDRLLVQSNPGQSSDVIKRLIETFARIPGKVARTRDLLERAKTATYRDRLANHLGETILANRNGIASYFCRDFPEEVISLVNARVRLTESDAREMSNYVSGIDEVEFGFGIRNTGMSNFFPRSAQQGPFSMLLRTHPKQGLEFLLDLINHAAEWYSTKRWQNLEPPITTSLSIPGEGDVEQWINGRLYCLYRGFSVGPSLISSVLMALESWLLSIGEMESADLEVWLLHVLRKSNSAMATSVVASVCIAYPEKAGRAGLALLSSKQIVECDQVRVMSEETTTTEPLFGPNIDHFLYEQERKKANALAHRKHDLEWLAIKMQLSGLQNEVWRIIDWHRESLPEDEDEDTREWRRALHRMDVREYVPQAAPKELATNDNKAETQRVYFGPGEPEPDIREMVDEARRSGAELDRHARLLIFARKAWNRDDSFDAANWRKVLLEEARAIEQELDEPEEFVQDGPGFAAAVCVRDHLNELDEEGISWCTERIDFEVRRNSQRFSEFDRARRIHSADRYCASVVPLLATHTTKQDAVDAARLLSLALTHPVYEVSDFAYEGLGLFLGDEHKDLILRCMAAAALQARLMSQVTSTKDEFDNVLPAVRSVIESEALDPSSEFLALDFNNRSYFGAIGRVLRVLRHHPTWNESRLFYSRFVAWVAEISRRERRNEIRFDQQRFALEHEALQQVAEFVLSLPAEDALEVCSPLLDCVVHDVERAERFLRALIIAADENASDCFWDLWQYTANSFVESPRLDRLLNESSNGHRLLHTLLLNIHWNPSVHHWRRLNGHAHLIDDLALKLPPKTACVLSYSSFLSTIGRKSLPGSFKVVSQLLEKANGDRMASHSSIAFNLESILQEFVYAQPHRMKKDRALRKAVLLILDALIAGGSSSAYRMRDDFVTPTRLQE